MTAKVANIRGYAVEKLLISSGHKMKNISCFIQILVHTPPFLKYIEVLPNHINNDRYDASLVSANGEFYSTLVIHDKKNASKFSWDGVISFALVDDGYLFVDKQDSLIVMSESTPRFLLKSEGKVVYVKSFNDKVLALYEDGNLKSTISMQKISNVISANFNSDGSIESK